MIGLKIAITAAVIFALVIILVNALKPKSESVQIVLGGVVFLCLLAGAGGVIAAVWGV